MFVRQKTTAGSKSCPKSKRLSFVFDKLERDGHSSPSVYAIRPSVVPTIRVLCGVGGRAKSVARNDEAGVERAQRRVTQEAAEEDKGRREKRTSCWEFFSGTRRISRGENDRLRKSSSWIMGGRRPR